MNNTQTDLDSRVTASIRAAYKWAVRDNPDSEICPNCHGDELIVIGGIAYPCPCQDKGKPSVVATKPPPIRKTALMDKSPMPQIATSTGPKMNIALGQDLGWRYDDLTIQLHALVLGMTGSGKTNTMYVIIEELLRADGLVTIIDPEGDYRFLKSQFPILIIGKGRKGNPIDVPVQPDSAHLIARSVVRKGVPIILDLSGFDIEAKNEFVAEYVEELWRQYQDEDLAPMRLVVDEVQLFAPQNVLTASKKLILDIASRGRKRHLTLMVATQRPQKAEKDLLDGMDIRVFHRLKRGSALNAVRDLLPYQLGDIQGKEINNVFANMVRGQATFEMEGREPTLIQVRPSDTYHPGTGPIVQQALPLNNIDGNLIDELQRIVGGSADFGINHGIIQAVNLTDSAPLIAELEDEIKRLYDELAKVRDVVRQRDDEIASLKVAAPEIDERSPLVTSRAINKQQREFNQFVNSLTHQHSGAQRAMLKFLLSNDANKYSLHEIARFSGYSVSTLSKLPQRLISNGYIWRQKGRKPIFQSTVRARLAQLFPDLNTEGLVGEILKVCK